MKLIVAVVHVKDADGLLRALASRGFGATTIDSSGGLLRQGNVTLLIGVQETLVADAVGLIKRHCQVRSRFVNPLLPVAEPAEVYVSNPVEVQVGGATIFVVSVERYERIA
ncbi:MAG: hypothetical protein QOF33_241 [Thermomicrobiales bacterium]|jgi:uncharacterized protein YaaQ|nr:hypothetical protein [Thermomicrobiales bacterium]MEA2525536.1 hypothetical protein [Thermomicrobiales bacterium]MEA2582156.1 hypothetical protein [Thermomicrobiales bacterium]